MANPNHNGNVHALATTIENIALKLEDEAYTLRTLSKMLRNEAESGVLTNSTISGAQPIVTDRLLSVLNNSNIIGHVQSALTQVSK